MFFSKMAQFSVKYGDAYLSIRTHTVQILPKDTK